MGKRLNRTLKKIKRKLYNFKSKDKESVEDLDSLFVGKKEKSRKNKLERDEDNYRDLIRKGMSETEAAHIINRIAEKRLKAQY